MNTLILITRNGMGQCEPELQFKLIVSYFNQLLSGNRLPNTLAFYGEGVKLAVSGSPALEPLAQLAEKGVKIRACTTRLNFYGILDRLKVGEAGTLQ
jgi:hypothetical protein